MNIFKEAALLQDNNISFAMVTITEAKGSTPRSRAKMIVLRDGSIKGTIGGGPVELHIIEEAKSAILEGTSRTVHSSLLQSGDDSVGMECGGDITLFIEVVNSRPKLLLIGGGHVNLAIAKAAKLLDFEIMIVDNRREFVSRDRFPMARECYFHEELTRAIAKPVIDRETYIIIATNHDDMTSIREVIDTPAAYIGMLGSRRKVITIMEDLRREGYSDEKLSMVYSPIGLDIGAETPEEIAFSVLSEILMVKNCKNGQSLRVGKNKGDL